MNLVDRYLSECVYFRNYNWIIDNLYIKPEIKFNPTNGQQEILLTRDNKKAFLLPRGAGSTTLICMDAIAEAMLNNGRRIIIFCPHQRNASFIKSKLISFLAYSDIDIHRNTQDSVELENKSIIYIFTPNPVSYRGYRADAVYIDNFDMFNSEELSNIFNRMMLETEKMLILGNSVNDYESTQRVININPRNL